MKSITLNENSTQITIDGKEYLLIAKDEDPQKPKEPELKTFEDCWKKINPKWFIESDTNEIQKANVEQYYCEDATNLLPTEKTAKQIQAAIKLFVVWTAINGEWHPKILEKANYVLYTREWHRQELYISDYFAFGIHNSYPFKSPELAQKAIDIAKDIWLEYYGIENK